MAQPNSSQDVDPGYSPDFELSHRGVIREDNWQEYVAQGFIPVPEPYELAQIFYGIPNVYTGDGYDYAEGRPLRHASDDGVYTNQDGLEYMQALLRDEDWFRQIHEMTRGRQPDDSAAS